MKNNIFFLLFFWTISFTYAQSDLNISRKTDSLEQVISNMPESPEKVDNLLALAEAYRTKNAPLLRKYADEALALAQQLKYAKGIAKSKLTIGLHYRMQSNYDKALEYYFDALKTLQSLKEEKEIATAYNYIATVYFRQGTSSDEPKAFQKAIEYFTQSLELLEKLEDLPSMVEAENMLSAVYLYSKDYENAIVHAQRGLALAEQLGQDYTKAGLLDALGGIYLAKNQLDSGVFYYQKALEIRQRNQDLQGIGLSYNNLARMENKRKNKQAALNYYKLANEVFEKINNKYYIASTYANIAEILLDMGRHQEAKPYTLKCLEVSRAIGNIPFQQSSYEQLVRIDSINQDFLSAFRHYRQYSALKDSVNDAQRSKQIAEMLTKYDTEKKDAENKLLRKEVDLGNAILQRTYAIGAGVAGVAVLLMVLAVVLYRSNKQKQETNKLLEKQKEEILLQNIELKQQKEEIQAQQEFIELKNAELATKNELIQSSIQAALNIQKSVLPKESLMKEILGEHLLLYLPRDIVSGDFYWVDFAKGRKIAAVFDCTGHGVPGAFMSLIGMTMLDRVIEHAQTDDPAEYLNKLEAEIYEQMNQDISRNEYGMDASIVSWKIAENGEIDLLYVGAKRPLYLFTAEGEFLTLKGNKKSVAQSMDKMATQPFVSERISLKSGCVFYICSDGFVDQNNEKRQRFSEKNFMQMLQNIYQEPFDKQKEIVYTTLRNFMGAEPQRDDIVLMGVKI